MPKISQLTELTSPDDDIEIPILDGDSGQTKRITLPNLLSGVTSGADIADQAILAKHLDISVADQTARDAIASPWEGLIVFREDLGFYEFYDGSAWQKIGISPVGDVVTTLETTSSTSYVDLATAGPAVTAIVPPSGKFKVEMSLQIANSVAGGLSYMSVALSGANTEAAADNKQSSILFVADNNGFQTYTGIGVFEGYTPGSTTFTAKYRVASNVGTFRHRSLIVTPLP